MSQNPKKIATAAISFGLAYLTSGASLLVDEKGQQLLLEVGQKLFVGLTAQQIGQLDLSAYFLQSPKELPNHDLLKALQAALLATLDQLGRGYEKTEIAKARGQAHIDGTWTRIKALKKQVKTNFFLLQNVAAGISSTDLQATLEGNMPQKLTDFLHQWLDIPKIRLANRWFADFLEEHFLLILKKQFVEQLKDQPRARIAFERLWMLQTKHALQQLDDKTTAIQEAIQRLEDWQQDWTKLLAQNQQDLQAYIDQHFEHWEIYHQIFERSLRDYLGDLEERLADVIAADGDKTRTALSEAEKRILAELGDLKQQIANPPNTEKFLTLAAPNLPDHFVGRKTDLARIHYLMQQNHAKPLLLVNGIGGVGKSTLAQAYWYVFEGDYDFLAWLSVTDSIDMALVNTQLEKSLGIDYPQQKIAERVAVIKHKLLNKSGKTLLVLDGANEADELATYDFRLGNCKILVTTRAHLEGSHQYTVDTLPPKQAKELFCALYTQPLDKAENQQLEELLEALDYHTLCVDLLARNLQQLAGKGYSLAKMCAALEKEGILAIRRGRIRPHYTGRVASKYDQVLLAMFNINPLSEAERFLLLQFAVLPSDFIPYASMRDFLQITEEQTEDFDDTLAMLVEKGWLEKNKDPQPDDQYKIHQLIQAVVLRKHPPKYAQLEVLVESFGRLLYLDQSKDNPVDKFKWMPYAESLLNYYRLETSPAIAMLQNNLALIYTNAGKYEKAKDLLKTALINDITNFGYNHPNMAAHQANLAVVYRKLGKYRKARNLIKIALKITTKHFGANHPDVATQQSILANIYNNLGNYEKAEKLYNNILNTQNFRQNTLNTVVNQFNLATTYINLGKYQEAQNLLETTLEFIRQNFGKNHPNVSKYQSALAAVYSKKGKNEKARDLLEVALANNLKNFGKNHSSVSTCQCNLGVIYTDLGNYMRAKKLLEMALANDLENFGKNHPSVATNYYNLVDVYCALQDVPKMKEAITKAYQIRLATLGATHPHTQHAKRNYDWLQSMLEE